MKTEKLSANFTFGELTKTTHKEFIQKNINQGGHPAIFRNLVSLCELVLQPIRDHFNSPVIITSGLRVFDLNRKIGGSENSQHLLGEAADFYIPNFNNETIFKEISSRDICCFGQLILEPSWIHISLPSVNKEKYNQSLIVEKVNGTNRYKEINARIHHI